MSLLLETIKLHKRQFPDLFYHNLRLNKTRKDLFGCADVIDIANSVNIPEDVGNGVYKCTITYNAAIVKVNFELYKKRDIKRIKVVHANEVDYTYKYADKTSFNAYLAQKGDCDEVLFVKNGMVTDTSFSNIAFFDGHKWVTPKSPLLKGTKREKLLTEGLLVEQDIKIADLKNFEKASLINCMLDLGETVVSIENLVY